MALTGMLLPGHPASAESSPCMDRTQPGAKPSSLPAPMLVRCAVCCGTCCARCARCGAGTRTRTWRLWSAWWPRPPSGAGCGSSGASRRATGARRWARCRWGDAGRERCQAVPRRATSTLQPAQSLVEMQAAGLEAQQLAGALVWRNVNAGHDRFMRDFVHHAPCAVCCARCRRRAGARTSYMRWGLARRGWRGGRRCPRCPSLRSAQGPGALRSAVLCCTALCCVAVHASALRWLARCAARTASGHALLVGLAGHGTSG